MARKQVQMAFHRNDFAGAATANGSNILDRGRNPDDAASGDFDEEARRPVGARPRSMVTRRHEPETNETEDGLSGAEEAIRHAAEDVPGKQDKDLPVFDEADAPPKIFNDEDGAEDDEQNDDEVEDEEGDDEDDENDDDEDEDEGEEEDEEKDEDED